MNNTIKQKILGMFMRKSINLKMETWIAYLDYNEHQIGDRENGKGTEVLPDNRLLLPPAKMTRHGVCNISIYDARENGNLLFQFWLSPDSGVEKGTRITTPPALP